MTKLRIKLYGKRFYFLTGRAVKLLCQGQGYGGRGRIQAICHIREDFLEEANRELVVVLCG